LSIISFFLDDLFVLSFAFLFHPPSFLPCCICEILYVQDGDVIFHTRWLFHRTVPFHRDVVSQRFTDKEDPLLYRRYSIRYGPGATSIIPNGWSTEPSVISEEKNGGRTADDVSQYDAAWYPR